MGYGEKLKEVEQYIVDLETELKEVKENSVSPEDLKLMTDTHKQELEAKDLLLESVKSELAEYVEASQDTETYAENTSNKTDLKTFKEELTKKFKVVVNGNMNDLKSLYKVVKTADKNGSELDTAFVMKSIKETNDKAVTKFKDILQWVAKQ